jgi:DNA polymerase-4
VKFQDFEQITRSRSFDVPVESRAALERTSLDLLSALVPVSKGVRLLGVTLSSLNNDGERRIEQLLLSLPD